MHLFFCVRSILCSLYGISLGTENIQVVRNEHGEVSPVFVESKPSVPSKVSFSLSEVRLGRDFFALDDNSNVVGSLLDPRQHTIGRWKETVDISVVLAFLLDEVSKEVRRVYDQSLVTAALSFPLYFTQEQFDLAVRAGSLSDLNVVALVPDTSAAIAAYVNTSENLSLLVGKRVLALNVGERGMGVEVSEIVRAGEKDPVEIKVLYRGFSDLISGRLFRELSTSYYTDCILRSNKMSEEDAKKLVSSNTKSFQEATERFESFEIGFEGLEKKAKVVRKDFEGLFSEWTSRLTTLLKETPSFDESVLAGRVFSSTTVYGLFAKVLNTRLRSQRVDPLSASAYGASLFAQNYVPARSFVNFYKLSDAKFTATKEENTSSKEAIARIRNNIRVSKEKGELNNLISIEVEKALGLDKTYLREEELKLLETLKNSAGSNDWIVKSLPELEEQLYTLKSLSNKVKFRRSLKENNESARKRFESYTKILRNDIASLKKRFSESIKEESVNALAAFSEAIEKEEKRVEELFTKQLEKSVLEEPLLTPDTYANARKMLNNKKRKIEIRLRRERNELNEAKEKLDKLLKEDIVKKEKEGASVSNSGNQQQQQADNNQKQQQAADNNQQQADNNQQPQAADNNNQQPQPQPQQQADKEQDSLKTTTDKEQPLNQNKTTNEYSNNYQYGASDL